MKNETNEATLRAEFLNRACRLAAQAKKAKAFDSATGEYLENLSKGWKRSYLRLTGLHLI